MISVLAVGKIKNKGFEAACQEYLKRLTKYARVSLTVLKDKGIDKEGKDVLVKSEGSYLVALSPVGVEMSSMELSHFLQYNEEKKITFVIGSEEGLSKAVLSKANMVLSMSRMTFPHELARVMFLEQLYRAFTIIKGEKYHK
ncbi:23S rRNA (pseudouridine(1915)-N(3))-methyltransferase RlmH [Candidatus Woesearchaeota archaeon]|nr:23S rRNA (pseudouridine(1915)-N(3))-methyltransferase RlmH [Candidatus Woesearchaeota archaeon]